jgi:hypothetical protein
MISKVFKASMPSVNYIFKNGKSAVFVKGRFVTSIASEISEIEEEIKTGHPHLFIDPTDMEEDSNAATPVELLKQKMREEILAEMAAATDPKNDMGSSSQAALKPASTHDIAPAAIGGSGEGLAARLMNLPISTGK